MMSRSKKYRSKASEKHVVVLQVTLRELWVLDPLCHRLPSDCEDAVPHLHREVSAIQMVSNPERLGFEGARHHVFWGTLAMQIFCTVIVSEMTSSPSRRTYAAAPSSGKPKSHGSPH